MKNFFYCLFLCVLFVGCGMSVVKLKSETDPFAKFVEKDKYTLYVLISEDASIDDKKAAKLLFDSIKEYTNIILTDNIYKSDFVLQILSSTKTYQTNTTTKGYVFYNQFTKQNNFLANTYTNNVDFKEISLHISTVKKVIGKKVKLNLVWSGFLRVNKNTYLSKPSRFIKILFSRFGEEDMDSEFSVDIYE